MGEGAVAFVGQSGAGKSTLALALAQAGCEHICDDTLPVEAGAHPVVWPSDHIIRLRPDTRGRLASCAHATQRESDGKFILTGGAFDPADVTMASKAPGAGRTPIAAIYLLRPAESSPSSDAVTRKLVGPTWAVPALMQHLKLDPVVGPADPARLVNHLGTIARSVPVFELTVFRDWTRIAEVVEQLMAWHSVPMDSASGRAPALAVSA
jgi:energy-coupling factor transporter ATP-binding protein EcfA2